MKDTNPNQFAGMIVTLIETIIVLGVSMGWFVLTETQVQLWIDVAVSIIAISTPLVGFMWAKRKVTSLADPRDSDGAPLVRESGGKPLAIQNRRR